MEFNQNVNLPEEDKNENNNLNVKDAIENYVRYWKWFLLSLLLCLITIYVLLNLTRPQYKAESTIKIKDGKGGDNSTLSVFEDLGVMGGSSDKIDDEIEILKSKGIISEVVKSLGLNVKFFTDKTKLSHFLDDKLGLNTEFYENERYLDPPIKINFLISDSLLYRTNAQFIISIISPDHFTYRDVEYSFEKKHAFGEKVNTKFGDIIFIPNTDFEKSNLIGSTVLINISSLKNITESFSKKVLIEPKSDFSSVLGLTIKDGDKRIAEDFLNEIVVKYNERAIRLKDELAKSTSDFVTKRLEIISAELSTVDLSAESLQTKYATSNTGLNMQSGQEIENQIVVASMQLEQIGSIKEFVGTKDKNELIPVDVGAGVADNNVSTTINQYNELMLQKKRLLENSTEKNPIVVNLNEQLITLKENIDQGLDNLVSSQQISIEALNRQDRRINSRLFSAPRQERQIRDVQRQQGIKEALYLYLLQKREETAITLGVSDPNAKIIDFAEGSSYPVSPNKTIFYLIALIVGVIIPMIVIYIEDFLDTKVKNRNDVEKILNIPILGDIPNLESKKPFLISKNDHSSIAEAFRILRTNLGFILTHSSKKGKIIFVTSTIAHEGKSFIASNLAASLCHAGKKTLILGMDIRAPKIKSYLGVRGAKGVTNYIIDQDLSIKDIIVPVTSVENLDLISSGDIAPNPAELLMNSRVKELFDSVKENYDYVIVDTAASSIITDTMLLRNYADAFIYVIRANYLDKRSLGYVKSIYRDKRFPNLALLVNGVDHKKAGYGYGYGYGSNFEKSKSKPWWKSYLK